MAKTSNVRNKAIVRQIATQWPLRPESDFLGGESVDLQQVINPWAYYADDGYKGYLHYESYRNGSTHSDFMKGYALKHFGAISLGVHGEMDFGVGPRIEARLADGLRLWGVVPVAHRPKEGEMKAMIGLSAEF